jgi:signal transduction histidine kinase
MLKRIALPYTRLSMSAQFRLASLIILVVGMFGIGAWTVQQIETGFLHSTSITTSLYMESFLRPSLLELAQGPKLSAAAISRLDNLLSDTPLGQDIVALKVWDTNGGVIYDHNHANIGKSFPIEERLAIASKGEVTTRISSLGSDENVDQRQFGQLIETYSPLRLTTSGPIVGVVEFYQKLDALQLIIGNAKISTWLVVVAAGLIMYLLLTLFVHKTSNTISSQQTALQRQITQLTDLVNENDLLNERVRNAARSFTTLNERLFRRVGSEIHDGPAQEVSLALLKLDSIIARNEQCQLAALSRNGNALPDACNLQLNEIETNLQQALQELRGIATGMSLPQLSELNLTDTIIRAVRAHERKTGTWVTVSLSDLPEIAPLPVKITIYRLVQEALNNAFRHAGGVGQMVKAFGLDSDLKIEITDQGPGFDVEQWKSSIDHLGLAGMRERVESIGGWFDLESNSGVGTRVACRLSLRAEGMVV